MTALALIASYIEAILPFSVGIPGVKLGLANIVVVVALYRLGIKYAFTINIIRIFLAGFLLLKNNLLLNLLRQCSRREN